MDIGRRNYSTVARPWRNSDETVTINWRRADPAAGTLPYPSRLCSLDWATEPWAVEGVGEVFGEDRTFLPKSLPTFPPTDHICGTEQDHREGGEYLPDLPPVTFREDGLPTCCGPMPEPPPEPASCPIPTATCALAPPGLLGEVCTLIPTSMASTWRRWAVTAGASYRLHASHGPGNTCQWKLWGGPNCGSLSLITSGVTSVIFFDYDFVAPSNDVWVEWISDSPVASPNINVSLLTL